MTVKNRGMAYVSVNQKDSRFYQNTNREKQMEGYGAVRLLVAKLCSRTHNIDYYVGGNHGTDRNVYCEGNFEAGEYLILV